MSDPKTPDERRTASSVELHAITDAVEKLVEHMDKSLPEERVKELVIAAVSEERRGRIRLIAAIVSPLLIVVALAVAQLAQSADIKHAAEDSEVVADYVRDCLITQPPAKTCGGDGDALAGFVKYLNCAFLITPAERTEAKLNACAAKAFTR